LFVLVDGAGLGAVIIPSTCVVILSWNMPGLHGLLARAKDFSYRR
jgi:hypothetical protein